MPQSARTSRNSRNGGNGGNRGNGAAPAQPRATGSRGSTFMGILIGLILGLGIALIVAWYINKLPSPFPVSSPVTREADPLPVKPATPATPVTPPPPADTAKDAAKDVSKDVAKDTGKDATKDAKAPAPGKSADAAPGTGDNKVSDGKDQYFIQTGSFQNQSDADNLKARLALLGLEAAVQSRTVPDKGEWFRVRVGPYTSVEELNYARGVLTQNNIESVMVKIRDADK